LLDAISITQKNDNLENLMGSRIIEMLKEVFFSYELVKNQLIYHQIINKVKRVAYFSLKGL
jgi:hypothetical protein